MIINYIRQIIILIIIISIVYILLSRMNLGQSYPVLMVPTNIKCFMDEDSCEQNNITIFTLIISALYGFIGYNFPDQYGVAIFSSVGFQILRQWMGYGSSYIVDPLANITAYTLGSIICPKQSKFREKYDSVPILK